MHAEQRLNTALTALHLIIYHHSFQVGPTKYVMLYFVSNFLESTFSGSKS